MTEAEKLLGEIQAWTVATNSTSSMLGQMVLNHGGFVPLLRKRGSLKPETASRMRAFMAAFPNRDALPPALIARLVGEARAASPWLPDRHHQLMVKFGYAVPVKVTASAPEAKPRISAAVIRAAKMDGRDLPTFVTALIDMGLECWRDDRAAHGEAVA